MKNPKPEPRKKLRRPSGRYQATRGRGYTIGITFAIAFAGIVVGIPDSRSKGEMIPGHEELECAECHEPASGTLRQQLQANTRWLLGGRDEPVAVGHDDVGNEACLRCHDRSDDRHPVFRFMEPRFKQARDELGAHQCESCHSEHSGVKVSTNASFCGSCHEDMNLKSDPIEPTHRQLAQANDWSSCLGCHDFHGNHDYESPTQNAQAIPPQVLQSYFDGADSPYGPVTTPAEQPANVSANN